MDVEQLTDCLWRLRTPVVQAGARILDVLLTHGHDDHTARRRRWPSAPARV